MWRVRMHAQGHWRPDAGTIGTSCRPVPRPDPPPPPKPSLPPPHTQTHTKNNEHGAVKDGKGPWMHWGHALHRCRNRGVQSKAVQEFKRVGQQAGMRRTSPSPLPRLSACLTCGPAPPGRCQPLRVWPADLRGRDLGIWGLGCVGARAGAGVEPMAVEGFKHSGSGSWGGGLESRKLKGWPALAHGVSVMAGGGQAGIPSPRRASHHLA